MTVLRTLVVDDDPDQRALSRALLDRAGIGPVAEAVDAEEALRQAVAHQPELILLDLEMPGRSGIDVLPELLATCPGAAIVVVSNLPRRRYEDAAMAAGAVGFVEKRVPIDRLIGEVLAAASLSAAAVERVTAELEQDATSPRAARQLVRSLLGAAQEELVGVVELLVTELVTNSVIHAASAPRVEVELHPDRVRIAVHDADPTMPQPRVPDVDRPGGRGLGLVDRLATRWGAAPSDRGKVVWFELERPTGPDAAGS
jgi:DNA-binding NarL/FixJ family response regulator